MIQRAQNAYIRIRGYLCLAVVLFFVLMALKGHCFNMEFEYVGPGSHAEALEREVRERDVDRSRERCNEGRGNDRDQERVRDWDREHMS